MSNKGSINFGEILKKVEETLDQLGVAVKLGGDVDACCEDPGGVGVKVVCVAPGVKSSVDEMSQATRDHVVMVRVDSATRDALDAWVETGAVKSRSEAAALFIREGLKVRADELARLKDALDGVEVARERLRKEAREIFGGDDPNE